jgi:hypothetical protein
VDTAKELSDFMCYSNSNLAKEIARHTGWRDKVWSQRYQSIVISDEEEVQIARLKYVLATESRRTSWIGWRSGRASTARSRC